MNKREYIVKIIEEICKQQDTISSINKLDDNCTTEDYRSTAIIKSKDKIKSLTDNIIKLLEQ